MTLYRIQCTRGAVTTVIHIVEAWAVDAADAFDQCRWAGYSPMTLDWERGMPCRTTIAVRT